MDPLSSEGSHGKRWMQDHPVPPTQTSEKRALLAWQPIFGDVSEVGDLGIRLVMGYKDDIKTPTHLATAILSRCGRNKPMVHGNSRRSGISHPESSGALKLWQIADEEEGD